MSDARGRDGSVNPEQGWRTHLVFDDDDDEINDHIHFHTSFIPIYLK